MAGRRGSLGGLVLLAVAIGWLAGCSANEFPVSPSLDPRSSRLLPLRSAAFLDGRPCLVYLPPGYPAPHTRYPVLYVSDGEVAFDGLDHERESFGFDATADAMIAGGEIEPLIIVAVTSAGLRFRDYIPSLAADGTVDTTRTGGAYVRALRRDLKPVVDRTFATDPAAAANGITGFSLGGLIAVYAGYGEPAAFGIAGGFSGSYNRGFVSWVDRRGRTPGSSLWIDTGLIDDNDIPARNLDVVARGQGFVPGVDYEYLEIADGTHTIASVRRRVPAFLRFFSRRSAGASALPALAGATPPGS